MRFPKSWIGPLAIFVFLGIAFVALHRRYYVRISLSPCVHVLWNQNEAFIFIYTEEMGAKGSPVSLCYCSFLGILAKQYDDFKTDLTIVHIVDGERDESKLAGVSSAGTPFALRGRIYYSNAKDNERLLWRWNGQIFVKLGHTEASSILSSFQYFSDAIKREGWHETDIPNSLGETAVEITLSQKSLKLILQKRESDGQLESVLFQGRTNAAAVESFAEIVPEWKRVSERDYIECFK